jgi:phosphoribosyl 1,2-cyclic phosphodiesterase
VRFASLGSGSRGNATLIDCGSTLLLLDCGFSLRATESRLDRLGVSADSIDAVLVTHEHSDHCSGVARLSRKYQIPVYLSRGTWASGRCEDPWAVEYFHSDAPFMVGDIQVLPIAVPHDANEPCQFVFEVDGRRLGVLTDLGSVTAAVTEHYRHCQALVLECNHDIEMLRRGPYPPSLQQRVGGDWGHLNNHQAAQLLSQVSCDQLQQLVIGHISEKNNSTERVRDALEAVVASTQVVTWADQQDGFDWLQV